MFSVMPLTKKENGREFFRPAYPLGRLGDEFEALFNRFFGGWPVPTARGFYPEAFYGVDMEETTKEYIFCVEAPGYRRIVTHLFDRACRYIETDVVYGVKAPLIVDFAENPPGVAPNGETVDTKFYTVSYDFVLQQAAEIAAAAE